MKDRRSRVDADDQDVAATIADDPDKFLSLLPQFYRGEINQATTAQDRIDRSTDWAVALIAAVLSLVFSSPDMPAYLLLIGLLVLCVFLWFEVRRYRYFDVARARVRLVQKNVFANALDPIGTETADWRSELSEDLRTPTFKVSRGEALSRRLRRVYGFLITLLVVAWIAKVTLFTPEAQWTEAAELPMVPGTVVGAGIALFFVTMVIVAFWPSHREAMGTMYGEEPGDWKSE